MNIKTAIPVSVLIVALAGVLSGIASTYTITTSNASFSFSFSFSFWHIYAFLFPVSSVLLLFGWKAAYWVVLVVLALGIIGGVSLIVMLSFADSEGKYLLEFGLLVLLHVVLFLLIRRKSVRQWLEMRSNKSSMDAIKRAP